MALSGALEDNLVSSRISGKGRVRAGGQAGEAPGVLRAEEESGGGAHMGGVLQVCGLRTMGRGALTKSECSEHRTQDGGHVSMPRVILLDSLPCHL